MMDCIKQKEDQIVLNKDTRAAWKLCWQKSMHIFNFARQNGLFADFIKAIIMAIRLMVTDCAEQNHCSARGLFLIIKGRN